MSINGIGPNEMTNCKILCAFCKGEDKGEKTERCIQCNKALCFEHFSNIDNKGPTCPDHTTFEPLFPPIHPRDYLCYHGEDDYDEDIPCIKLYYGARHRDDHD